AADAWRSTARPGTIQPPMAVLDLAQLTWEEVRDLDRAKAVAILHVGAIEAHGPHLPLATDVIIAETMARAAAARLATHGYDAVLLAPRPELVRDAIRLVLPANPRSLSTAIRSGQTSFEAAGGPRAYFGSPADAGADEGVRTIEILGTILAEAVLAELPG